MKNYLNPVLFFLFLCVSTLSAQPGKLISHAFYVFETGTGSLLSGDSFTVAYSSQLLPDMYRNYKLSDTGTWHVTSRSVFYEYDAGENLLGFTQQVGNDQDGWTNTWRYSNTYNANNQELSSKLEKWDGNGWILNSLNEKEYDAAGNLISSSGQSVRTLYTYNAEGLLESEITQYNIGNDWLNSAKEAYSYVAGTSHVDVQTTFYWAAGAWGGSARQTFQYDANGHNTQLLLEYWSQNQWNPSFRRASEYDAAGNLVYYISGDWNGVNWEDDTRQFNTYDENNHFTSARLEQLNGVTWELSTFGRLRYGALSGNNGPVPTIFNVYPNPASEFITLGSEKKVSVFFFDAHGKQVESAVIEPYMDHTVPVAHLAAGAYYLKITGADGKTQVKPLIIQR